MIRHRVVIEVEFDTEEGVPSEYPAGWDLLNMIRQRIGASIPYERNGSIKVEAVRRVRLLSPDEREARRLEEGGDQ